MQPPNSDFVQPGAVFAQWQLGFGVVRHTRKYPVSNAFSYRSFFIEGDAMTLTGAPKGNWLFGVNRRALLAMHIKDHGNASANLDWVQEILVNAGLPEAGVIRFRGFPRVLGYAFKPVSFWLCADDQGKQFAVVAEVNNTFGERHCYLLANPDHSPLKQGQILHAVKAFHVSPFRKIRGDYQFRFIRSEQQSVVRIDHYETAQNVLHTSISGTHVPLTRAACLRAVFCYPLFTFGVVTRIHWQAVRLWVKRVPFIAKPSPPSRFVTPGSDLKE